MAKYNVGITGGPCTGKSTLAAFVYAMLKAEGKDYDLITEERRHLGDELGACKSPFDRFYLWRQQEREELRSRAALGFVSDTPLFQFYVEAQQRMSEPRDKLAVRELYRMCLELPEDRYSLIVMAEDPFEIEYKFDTARTGGEQNSRERHQLLRNFIGHMWPSKLMFVSGTPEIRARQVLDRIRADSIS